MFTDTIRVVFTDLFLLENVNKEIPLRLNIEPLSKTYYIGSGSAESKTRVTVCGGVPGESTYIKGYTPRSAHEAEVAGYSHSYTFNSNGCIIFHHAWCGDHDHAGTVETYSFSYRNQNYVFKVYFR